jgi:tetratricopeptide (TPR) repeat protein
VRALRKGLALAPHDRWPDLPALLGELAALRARRRRRWIAAGAAGVVGLAITAALVVARSEPPVDRCARGLAALAEAYNPALDAQLGAVLAHEPAIRDRVRTQLAAVASAWTATQHATCHADRDVAQDARTAACLDARRIELAGTVDDVIANGAAGARYAVALARLPGAPAACAAPGPGLLFARVPADRALRRQVTALRTALCDADDAYDQADFPRALATAERAVAASATIWPPLHAEALFSLGKIQQLGGDSKLANATLRDTAVEAERAHHDRIAALSWAQLAIDAVDAARALEYVAYAEAAADRIGRPAAVMARIVYVKGSTLASADRTDEAEVVLHQAIELAETIDTDDLPRAIGGLGLVYFNQGRYAEAATALRKAIAQLPRSESGQIIGEPAYFTSLAHALSNLGQTAEAEVEARRAIEIADRTLPETQLDRQITHLELAAILHDLDRNDDALAEATRAIAGIEKIHGTRSQPWANAVAFRAEILTDVERYQEAEPLFARACEVIAFTAGVAAIEYAECEIRHSVALDGLHRDAEALAKADLALALYLKLDGESHPATADSYRVRGIVHAALHHHRAAIADLERATALLTDVKADPGHLAIAKWRLGKERWADQPVRARAEIREALVLFETATASWSRERAKAAAWLASHDRAHPAR